MYFRFDIIGPEIEYFLKNGSFTDAQKDKRIVGICLKNMKNDFYL